MEAFSCLMSCYVKDNPIDLARALQSLAAQTVKASEVLLVEDGPLSEGLYRVIQSFESRLPLNRLQFKENRGLGHALKKGVEACNYPLIARMDADDISRSDRFATQLKLLEKDPKLAVVGSWVSEFDKEEENIYAVRKVPLTHLDILKKARYRNPLNHSSVMFRRKAALDSGNYNSDFQFAQDYVLWMRMLSHGYKFANISECLVSMKAGREMIKRRGGWKYIKCELALQKEALKLGFISFPEYSFNVVIRSIVRIVPDNMRDIIYRKTLRK